MTGFTINLTINSIIIFNIIFQFKIMIKFESVDMISIFIIIPDAVITITTIILSTYFQDP